MTSKVLRICYNEVDNCNCGDLTIFSYNLKDRYNLFLVTLYKKIILISNSNRDWEEIKNLYLGQSDGCSFVFEESDNENYVEELEETIQNYNNKNIIC